MSIKPLYDRVVVRRLEAETTTESGIIIPDAAAEQPAQGEIVAVGDGLLTEQGERRPLAVSVGDQVIFGQYAGSKIQLNGEELLVMKESDILAVVEWSVTEEKAA
ncbi:co-chaperone GroES [Oceanospirillum beijerinckii]|uniref:co-chaperone GroES n=1 Tax=Oceanospirillum beijerinckii TaxID=64976 RepID=UPI000407453F|nr:co-chaperone GroES [Oceanospirillum beijerinckii]